MRTPGHSYIRLDGEIVPGDAERFVTFIRSHQSEFLQSSSLMLNSSGGSVQEALKLSSLIEESGLMVAVEQTDTCASACFMLFVSGSARLAAGRLVVHRPYFDPASVSPATYLDKVRSQQSAVLILRNFLESRAVPGLIIEKMMSLPSNNGYLLSIDDKRSLGVFSPMVEELAIRNCDASNASDLLPKNVSCVAAALQPVRSTFLEKISGQGVASIAQEGKKAEEAASRVQQAKQQIAELGQRLAARDPRFKEKIELMRPELQRIQRELPPEQWVSEVERLFNSIQLEKR